jgi:hypothetical protein
MWVKKYRFGRKYVFQSSIVHSQLTAEDLFAEVGKFE